MQIYVVRDRVYFVSAVFLFLSERNVDLVLMQVENWPDCGS